MESPEEIKRLLNELQKSQLLKPRKEVIRDAIRETRMRYGIYPKEKARDILNKKITGKLSDTIREVREG